MLQVCRDPIYYTPVYTCAHVKLRYGSFMKKVQIETIERLVVLLYTSAGKRISNQIPNQQLEKNQKSLLIWFCWVELSFGSLYSGAVLFVVCPFVCRLSRVLIGQWPDWPISMIVRAAAVLLDVWLNASAIWTDWSCFMLLLLLLALHGTKTSGPFIQGVPQLWKALTDLCDFGDDQKYVRSQFYWVNWDHDIWFRIFYRCE